MIAYKMSEMAVFYRVVCQELDKQKQKLEFVSSEEIMKNETLLPLELVRNCLGFFPSEGMLLH